MKISHYINGQPVVGVNKIGHTIYNPALGEIIGHVPFAHEEECKKAIRAAEEAFPLWSKTTPGKRAKIFFRFRELLERYQQDLAKIITREHGKTLEDARGSIARAIEVVEFNCGIMSHLQGDFSFDVAKDIDCYTFYQPLGVCAGVSPFNFPVMVPVWMMIPALACGNTFILKPSEQNPSAPLRLMELLQDAGLPAGVANCVQGNYETVDFLLHSKEIKTFTAVASTPVAESIYKKAIENGKRAHTFGGAKNHCVVLPDADLARAAEAIVGAAYGSAGERCMAISAVVCVGEETTSLLLAELIPLIEKIKIDAGDVPGCDMGPLISKAHRDRVIRAIDQGVAEGAKLLLDGRGFIHPEHPQGFFIGPSLFVGVKEEMSLYQQEIFGPVLILLQVKNLTAAIDLVNRNQYGNGTAIFTRDGYSARHYSEEIQVGMVGINIPIPVPVASHPFGGWKQSSFGDSNMHGLESIHFYTKRKTVTSKWLLSKANNTFAMPIHDEEHQ